MIVLFDYNSLVLSIVQSEVKLSVPLLIVSVGAPDNLQVKFSEGVTQRPCVSGMMCVPIRLNKTLTHSS